MADETVAVEHIFTVTANTAQQAVIAGAPSGTRVMVNVSGGTFEGPNLKGTVLAGGGDWVTARADGSVKLDVRITLQTDDGAHILMTYSGIGVRGEDGLSLRTAPLFETGAEKYLWLNNIQAIAHGTPGKGEVTYVVYALK